MFVTQLMNSVAVCINVHMAQGPCTNIVLVQKNILTQPTKYYSGPSCSKLTTPLVNDSLKFTLSDT